MRVLVAAGARPNFIKVAPVLRAFRARGHDVRLVHTGQHYDTRMSDAFFRDLQIPEPDYHLHVGSASYPRLMAAFEPVLRAVRPEWLVVPGDVNSTLACAMVAARLRPETGVRIAHVEAGLRSGDWTMPEEVNRVLTDRISDVLLTPSRDAAVNLAGEGISAERVAFVGNVMVDSLLARLPAAHAMAMPARMGLRRGRYAVATLHRASNVDDPSALRAALSALARIADEMPVVLPMHPRTRARVGEFRLGALLGRLRVLDPLGYTEMLSLTAGAAVVLTDSGGLQEEATVVGVPCITLREQTERPVTIAEGTNRLAPWPLDAESLLSAFLRAAAEGRAGVAERCPEGWDGAAAPRIVDALEGRVRTG